MEERVHTFNPGPAALPLPVLERIRDEMLNFRGTGMSILEVSHRSRTFEEVLDDAAARLKRLLKLDNRFHVVFLQGGASLQFAMVPMNLALEGKPVGYVDTGYWASKALKEAQILGKDVQVVASSKAQNYTHIPKNFTVDDNLAYLHLTSNNTIEGTQWHHFPGVGNVPLVSDMSSDILSRVFDPSPFGLIYAGAQKNLGPAGVTVVIIREDMLERTPKNLPTMLRYSTFVESNSLYNTPPCFAIYVVDLVLEWLEETVGGLETMEAINRKKAKILYDYLDSQNFYTCPVAPEDRSMMNVVFRLPSPELEDKFVKEAEKARLVGLKGHRSVGGCRASLYNAVTVEAVQALVDFMQEFARKNA
ncbi:3-phosphoserine/phosphohydroxythreonine transaminase [Candidatus Caldatribacterium sp. SIUC1]|uniref:3-phosphoserine/phosphohydroxythreonine transaminase n=1 Tax=Candidatus Caldatribacterium sp. SIUC1 TaxID=3418365 RepID=UPI003F68D050